MLTERPGKGATGGTLPGFAPQLAQAGAVLLPSWENDFDLEGLGAQQKGFSG